jgi:hypothetical protein
MAPSPLSLPSTRVFGGPFCHHPRGHRPAMPGGSNLWAPARWHVATRWRSGWPACSGCWPTCRPRNARGASDGRAEPTKAAGQAAAHEGTTRSSYHPRRQRRDLVWDQRPSRIRPKANGPHVSPSGRVMPCVGEATTAKGGGRAGSEGPLPKPAFRQPGASTAIVKSRHRRTPRVGACLA